MKRRVNFRASFGLVLGLLLVLALSPAPQSMRAAEKRGFHPDDIYQLQAVSDPRLSPDGKAVAFVVSTIDRKQNRRLSAIWTAASDGSTPAAPFTTAQSSRNPRWSPDGRWLAFLSARPDADAPAAAPAPRTQVHLLRVDGGGEARRLTTLKEGVDDFSWSPDGAAIVCVGRVPSGPVPSEAAPRTDVRHYVD